MTLWLVHAGKYGEREQMAREKNLAIIGWEELPDLSQLKSREDLTRLLKETYPEEKNRTLSNWESQLWSFSKTMQVGDLVAMPLKARPVIVFGTVTGSYKYEPDFPERFKHTRPVQWKHEIPRSKIASDLLYSLTARPTVCKIARNDAENRIIALLGGASEPPGPTPEIEAPINLEQLARDQISDAITQNFKGHKFANLVAAVLQAQGYKLHISPKGPDGGVDIIAGRGPLGFESPRLVVQVKSSDSAVDVKVFRELKGVLDGFNAESGLIVAWGGYKGNVDREAARDFFKTRLWTADDLVQMIQDNYDQLPEDIQSELPLKRVWMLIPEEEE